MRNPKFITIEIKGKAYDWPKDMPLPKIGERVIFNGDMGVVDDITHSVENRDSYNFWMITIKTSQEEANVRMVNSYFVD